MTARTPRPCRRTSRSPARLQAISTQRSSGTGTQLQEGVSYRLSTLAAGVDVTKYASGRVFVSLGSPLIDLSAGNNYAPNFVAPGSAKFHDPDGQIRNHLWRPGGRRPADRRRQSELDRFLWHPSEAADKRRQSADDAHLELQRRRQHGLRSSRTSAPCRTTRPTRFPTPSAPSSPMARTASRSTRPADQ